MNLQFVKYGTFFTILIFFPIKIASIIFEGLGLLSFPPITLAMYFFSFFVVTYYILVKKNKVHEDSMVPWLIKASYLFIVTVYILTFFYTVSGFAMFIAQYAGFLLSFVSYLVLGVFLFRFYTNGSLSFVFLAWLLGVLPILMIGSLTDFSINYKLLFGDSGYDYLLVGDIVVLLSFVLLLKLPEYKKYFIAFVLIATLFILFKNGSRSSFYAFSISLLISALIIYRTKALLFILFVSLLIFLVIVTFNIDISFLTESRIVMLLGTGESSSISTREQLHFFGLKRIFDNFFLGDMLGQIEHPIAVSPFGSYMHSIFSHYSQFGLVAFLLYVASWLVLYFFFIKKLNFYSKKEKLMILSMMLYATISLTFSRAFVHTIFEGFWVFLFLNVTSSRTR